MIRINCGIITETLENRKKAIELAKELVAYSLHEKGCLEYDLLGSLTNTDRLMIYETWENEAALNVHKETEHFKRLVPEIQKVATMTSGKFNF